MQRIAVAATKATREVAHSRCESAVRLWMPVAASIARQFPFTFLHVTSLQLRSSRKPLARRMKEH